LFLGPDVAFVALDNFRVETALRRGGLFFVPDRRQQSAGARVALRRLEQDFLAGGRLTKKLLG
jgi:hypothetical protein